MNNEGLAAELVIELAPPGAVPFAAPPFEEEAPVPTPPTPPAPPAPPAPPVKKIEFVLKPIAPPPEETPGFTPWPTPYKRIPEIIPITHGVVINCETTGIGPWDSRLISIGAKDASKPFDTPTVFIGGTEEELLLNFVAWYESQAFDQIIGYNISFDFRMLFAKAMRYQRRSKMLFDSSLTDMMQIMKQVQEAFVFGFNRPGTLAEWSLYLFNDEKEMTAADVLEAWLVQDLEKIANFNASQVERTFKLWVLAGWITGKEVFEEVLEAVIPTPPEELPPEEAAEIAREAEVPTGSVYEVKGFKQVISKNSFQVQWIPEGAFEFRDVITGLIEEAEK